MPLKCAISKEVCIKLYKLVCTFWLFHFPLSKWFRKDVSQLDFLSWQVQTQSYFVINCVVARRRLIDILPIAAKFSQSLEKS